MTKRSNFCCFSEILIANLEVEPKNYFKRFTLRNLKPLNTSEFLSWSFFLLVLDTQKGLGFLPASKILCQVAKMEKACRTGLPKHRAGRKSQIHGVKGVKELS